MKLSKILLGAVAGAAVLGLVSCGNSDDKNGMIKGSASKYTIDYTNETADVSRGYRATAMKHAGGLVKITFDKNSDTNAGVMGFIFDLKKNEEDSSLKDFFVAGIKQDGNFYISKFTKVKDVNAYNFGASDKEDATEGTTETKIVPTTSATFIDVGTLSTDDDGNAFVYLYAYCNNDGSFDFKVLDNSATDKVKSLTDKEFSELTFDSGVLQTVSIPASVTGYTGQTQNNLAVYANVYANKTLTGTWNFVGTYKEAEVIE